MAKGDERKQGKGGTARRGRGFRRAIDLMSTDLARAGRSRGFDRSRLLTHWDEVAGPDLAAMCRPLRLSAPRRGLGAVLTVLCRGAEAPLLQMRLPVLRSRVNAAYGYEAVARIVLSQAADLPGPGHGAGFAEAQAPFAPPPPAPPPAAARDAAAGVGDPTLRAALERLGGHIISGRPRPSRDTDIRRPTC
jgi:hypothetical protein